MVNESRTENLTKRIRELGSKKPSKYQFTHDHVFKYVFERNIKEALELFDFDFNFKEFVSNELYDEMINMVRADLIFETYDDEYVIIEFQSTKITEEDKRRFGNYQSTLYAKYGKKVKVVVISIVNEETGRIFCGYEDLSFLLHGRSTLKWDAGAIINNISYKIKYNKRIVKEDIVLLEILPYTKSEKSRKELLKIAIDLRRKIKNVSIDKLRELMAVQQILAKIYFDDEEYKKFLEEDNMQSIDLQEVALQEVIQFQNNKKFEEGKKEGKKEGKIEGKQETKEEYIKNMLKEGIPTKTITKITGSNKKEIQKIKNKEKERQKAYA